MHWVSQWGRVCNGPCLSCKPQCVTIPFPQAPEQKHPQATSESSPGWGCPCSGSSLLGPGLQATRSRNCTLCDPRKGIASAGLQVWGTRTLIPTWLPASISEILSGKACRKYKAGNASSHSDCLTVTHPVTPRAHQTHPAGGLG